MINIRHLTQKCIINASVLYQLREQTAAETSTNPQAFFLDKVDGLINDHLRGMDFKTRRQVRQKLIETHFSANSDLEITYYDAALILISLDLPVNQIITNFQNWILMSTEFSLTSSEIAQLCLEEANSKTAEFQTAYQESLPTNPQLHIIPEESISLLLDNDVEAPFDESIESLSIVTEEDADPITQEAVASVRLKYKFNYGRILIYCLGLLVLPVLVFILTKPLGSKSDMGFADASSLINIESYRPTEMKLIVRVISAKESTGFPDFLSYELINRERMQGYLKRKNSLLANEPYFSAVLHSAALQDIHPVLLFAITGQEQGFVKRGSENAALIVNNPFNVYTSWIEYNTNIEDSSSIAAETVKNILSDRKKGENPFQWLNKTYAEDPKWGVGVERLFLEIENYLGPYDLDLNKTL